MAAPRFVNEKFFLVALKDRGYRTGVFGKWAGGYEGSASTPDKRGVDEFCGYVCQFHAHLCSPNLLNRFSRALGDTAVVREVMEDNMKYPMFGRKRSEERREGKGSRSRRSPYH